MRDHRFTRARASDYLDGELGEADRARIHDHTGLCPPCSRMIESLRRTIGELRALRAPSSTSVADGVIARLRDEP